MWKRIAPLLVVLSIGLNVALVSVWVIHAARSHWPVQRADDGGIWCPLHRQLGVTDEQWRQIEPLVVRFHERSQAICAETNRQRAALIDLLAAEEPDRRAIDEKQEEIRASQQRMQELVIEHLLAEKDLLTVEQQSELFDLIRQRSAGQGRRGLMNPTLRASNGRHPNAHPGVDEGGCR